MRRRMLLATMTLVPLALRPLAALAQWHKDAFSATSLPDALRALFGERAAVPSAVVVLDVEAKIENGAVVPMQINVTAEGVTAINILAEKNPNPLLARFHLSARCKPMVATRVKIGAPSDVIIVVETKDQLLSATRFVEVVEGGCT